MKISHRIGLFIVALVSGPIAAHDFWMEAHPFYTAPSDTVELSLHVGNDFVGDSMPNIASWYHSFNIYSVNQISAVGGSLGRDPAGYFEVAQLGTYLLGYQSVFQNADIDYDTFVQYLDDEGLVHARALIEQDPDTSKRFKERYKRHVKTLVQSGTTFEYDNSRYLIGHDLELVPEQNPYQLELGNKLGLTLYYQGQPAIDIQVAAFSKAHPEQVQYSRTNRLGQVSVVLDQTGPWLVKAVRIHQLKDQKHEWESHWASLTFTLLPASPD